MSRPVQRELVGGQYEGGIEVRVGWQRVAVDNARAGELKREVELQRVVDYDVELQRLAEGDGRLQRVL